jgi:hypothetical protein
MHSDRSEFEPDPDPDLSEFEPEQPTADDEARWEAYRALMRRTGDIQLMRGLDDGFEDPDHDGGGDWRLEEDGYPDQFAPPAASVAASFPSPAPDGPSWPNPPMVADLAAAPVAHDKGGDRNERRRDRPARATGWSGRLIAAGIAATAGVMVAAAAWPGLQHQGRKALAATPPAAASHAALLRGGLEGPVKLAAVGAPPCLAYGQSAAEFAKLTEPAAIVAQPAVLPLTAATLGEAPARISRTTSSAPQLTRHRSVQAHHCLHCRRAHLARLHDHARRHAPAHARQYAFAAWWGH